MTASSFNASTTNQRSASARSSFLIPQRKAATGHGPGGRQADVIFVVNDHTLVERGTHDELLASGGFYSELYNIQSCEDEPVTAALC